MKDILTMSIVILLRLFSEPHLELDLYICSRVTPPKIANYIPCMKKMSLIFHVGWYDSDNRRRLCLLT